jgi:hypothetical protein
LRRLATTLILGISALLLTHGAAGGPEVPGDPTPPVVTPVITGTLGNNSWHVTNVTVSWIVMDPESLILDTTGCDTKTLTGETTGMTLTCSAMSDGGTTTVSKTFKIDKTPPAAIASLSRGADANGWYNHALIVGFSGSDAMSGLDSCSPAASYGGPDSANASVVGSCRDKAGLGTAASVGFKYDATAPTLTPAPSRAPDSNGWYTRALAVSFLGTDATSGVVACSSAAYAGSDSPSAAVAGSCHDYAGNVGAGIFSFKYDATAPTVFKVWATAGNRIAQISWRAAPDSRLVEVTRAPGRKGEPETMVYRGSAGTFRDTELTVGRRYHYRVKAFDDAGNSASRSVALTAAGALFSPVPGEKVSSPPRLRWSAVKGARFYNLQLIRGGGKVLSVWPTQPSFQLRRTWIYKGRSYRLRPGVYRWYVWPRLASGRYGRLIGSSRFVMAG